MADTAVRSHHPSSDSKAAARDADAAASRAARTAEAVQQSAAEDAKDLTDKAENLARQGGETVQRTVDTGLDLAGQVVEKSIEQFAEVAGLPTEQTRDSAQQSLRNVQAMLDGGAVIINAVQQAQREWLGTAGERMSRQMEAFHALLSSRNFTELAAAQTDLARRQLEELVAAGQRTSELVGEAARTAIDKIRVDEKR